MLSLFQHHGAAVVEDLPVQIARRIVVKQIVVHGVAAGDQRAVDEHHVADFERANFFFRKRRLEYDLSSRKLEPFAFFNQALDGPVRVAVKPFADGPARGVEQHAQAAERPAVVGDRDEEACRQAVRRGDLAADERGFAAETHRADAQAIGFFHHFLFELGERVVGVGVVKRAEELLLGKDVAVGAVAADANAEGARRAAHPLRLPDGVENALLDALQVSVGLAQMLEHRGQRILDVLVLAAAAFAQQADFDFRLLPLLEFDDRGSRTEVVATVLPG